MDLDDRTPVLYVFKTMNEAGVGELSLFRVYAGEVRGGQELFNPARGTTERIGQLYVLNGQKRTPVTSLNAGDLGAAVKLRDTHTGNTLCDPTRPVMLPEVNYPAPNIHGALSCDSPGDEDKFAIGLATLREEDPSFQHRVDDEIHQTIVSGQGELHLKIALERLQRRFGISQFAEVWMRIAPGSAGSGIDFRQSLVGTNVDRVFVPSVEKGVKAACDDGILAGCRIVDVVIDFYDGKMHPVDSKDVAFQIAGSHAFRDAFADARPCLLEPIYEIVVTVPADCVGDIMGDLSSRRGHILGVEAAGHFQSLRARVPQRELHHYSTRLRSLTASRGTHTETFVAYERVPHELEATVIAEAKESRA